MDQSGAKARGHSCRSEFSMDQSAARTVSDHSHTYQGSPTEPPHGTGGSPSKEPAPRNQPGSRDPAPPDSHRSLVPAGTPSSIPLTGDLQTDADILAFVRARHNLLSRTGAAQQ
ncbi:hypothetical protein ANANG_G00025100 [Anguilla anguilla]|uniref:Uncharacterized protein n=1 Tax=Anguilla anguilla TaxID=7936 RepID=A0A9D3S6Z6_ANGAN|nr:hypothetical protein ANANG_G00025100 [Anguilla anguilla]